MKRFHLRHPKTFNAILGWVGALLILLAYYLISFEVMRPDQISWQAINLLGSIGIVAAAFPKKDWPAMWLNIVFAAIALTAVIRLVV